MSIESDLQSAAAAVVSGSPTTNAFDLGYSRQGDQRKRNLEEPFASTGQQGTWSSSRNAAIHDSFAAASAAVLDPKWKPSGGSTSPVVVVREITREGQDYYVILARVAKP